MNNTLAEKFQCYFTVDFAFDNEQKQDVFKVRYNVYCKEFEYEPLENFPDEQEFDAFDLYSLHCLIRHKESGQPAGCVRLVPSSVSGKDTQLPFEKYCQGSLDQAFIDKFNDDRKAGCEISRLAVDATFRRRLNEKKDRYGGAQGLTFAEEEKRMFPLIAISALLATMSLAVLTGRTTAIAMMEPFLPRLLKRSGLFCQRAGQDIDYHGIRAPYSITIQSALDNMKPELKQLFDVIHERISTQYESHLPLITRDF